MNEYEERQLLDQVQYDAQAALQQAHEWISRDPLIFDTETTGLEDDARIVSLAIVDVQGNVLFSELINPQIPIPLEASHIHGITNDLVATARTWPEVYPRVGEILNGRLALSYNIDFDLRMLKQTSTAYGLKFWPDENGSAFSIGCIMQLYAAYNGDWNERYGNYRFVKLSQAAEDLCIPAPILHNALADAQLARQVLLRLAGRSKIQVHQVNVQFEERIRQLAGYRSSIKKAKEKLDAMIAAVKEADDYKFWSAVLDEAQKAVIFLEPDLRQEAQEIFEATGYRYPHDAITVKNISELEYLALDAIEWCKANLPNAIDLNVRLFEKHARAIATTAPLPFVSLVYKPQAQIDTDLSGFLPQEEPKETMNV
ncbi:MAG: 3'-5' exonuclease [Desulforudis sp.]|nr:MAG: 3'-5' exonuclease [Desulforudis sp.]